MSTDYDELAGYDCKHYVLDWKTATSAPKAEAIEVTGYQRYEDKDEGWVTFTYLTGDHIGCASGAPRNRIFNKAESADVLLKLSGVRSSLLRKTDLQAGVTSIKKALGVTLSAEDRTV